LTGRYPQPPKNFRPFADYFLQSAHNEISLGIKGARASASHGIGRADPVAKQTIADSKSQYAARIALEWA
jgi:hypothetical protein